MSSVIPGDKPLISVVVPVYNGERTIRQTIESICNQSYDNLEVLVINDGSSDGTLAVLQKITDARLRVRSFANAGLAASRNRGIAHASGSFISFIDADDIWTPDKLMSQLEALHQNPTAGVAYSWTDFIDEFGAYLYSGCHADISGHVYGELLVRDFLENGSNALIRREVFQRVGLFDETLPAAEDWDWFLRAARHFAFALVPAPQVLYRVTATSMSSNLRRQEKAMLTVIDRAFADAPDQFQQLRSLSVSNMYRYLMFRSLDSSSNRSGSAEACRYLTRMVVNNIGEPFHNPSLFLIAIVRICLTALLPPQTARFLLGIARALRHNVRLRQNPQAAQ